MIGLRVQSISPTLPYKVEPSGKKSPLTMTQALTINQLSISLWERSKKTNVGPVTVSDPINVIDFEEHIDHEKMS